MLGVPQPSLCYPPAMDKAKITYYVSTGLLTVMMLGSAGMYIFNHEEVAATFASLGYPAHIIYPLAAAKLLGLLAIWTNVSPFLRNLAYAGFFYDFVLAAMAHITAGDGDAAPAIVAIVLVAASYWSRGLLTDDLL